MTQSAVRLTEALYVRPPAAQLLGAVTAIEILVSDQIETYDQMRRRIAALLGREALDQYAVEGVLRARHRYVHQGDPGPARAMVPPAMGLALACLVRYAAAAPAFPDKGALLDYLDWAASGDRLARVWTPAEQRTLARGPKHTPAPLTFPFLTPPAAAAEAPTSSVPMFTAPGASPANSPTLTRCSA